jgi:hypothetical protein
MIYRFNFGRKRAACHSISHHTDAEGECAYGAESKIGTFSEALMAEAKKNGWTVLSMKNELENDFPVFRQVTGFLLPNNK